MEIHGKNPRQNVIAIIPARYASTRLAGKMLLEIEGKPLILHTLGQAARAENVTRVIVATDDERIQRVVQENGGEAVMTSGSHQSGSDRIAEVAENLPADSIIVNVQGDEPLISPRTIETAVNALIKDESADIVTASTSLRGIDELLSPNVVKVGMDRAGYALYFSRSSFPVPRMDADVKGTARSGGDLESVSAKHIGIYVYRREYLLQFAKLPPSNLEQIEMLEQLRALENGARIKVVEIRENSIGVDTLEDFERVKTILENRKSKIGSSCE